MTYSTAFWMPESKAGCIHWLSSHYGDKYEKSVYAAKTVRSLKGWISDIRKKNGRR